MFKKLMDFKKDFPIFSTHPDLVYLDSTSTSQKPNHVLNGVKDYLSSSYANIHRWNYDISSQSEALYKASKQSVASHIWASHWREVVYSANSTYALNLLSQSIWRTGLLEAGDIVLVSVAEHHANIVPWLILKQDYGIELEFIWVNSDYSLDMEDLHSKLNNRVKIVSLTQVSNVTGQIFDLQKVSELLDTQYSQDLDFPQSLITRKRPLFIVDGSQSVPHFQIDVEKIWCDALFFTGHKIFAESGIGVLWAKKSLLDILKPIFSWGWAIAHVSQDSFTHSSQLPDKFEPGTPNLNGAVSLLKAFEYIDSIWWYEALEQVEQDLVEYVCEKFKKFTSPPTPLLWGEVSKWKIKIIGSLDANNRVWVFSFVVEWVHSFDISDYLAQHNICIRAGQHCAEPLMNSVGQMHTCRMSLHIYNTKEDIDRFFEILEQAIKELK